MEEIETKVSEKLESEKLEKNKIDCLPLESLDHLEPRTKQMDENEWLFQIFLQNCEDFDSDPVGRNQTKEILIIEVFR